MKKIFYNFFLLLIISCSKNESKEPFKLEILNKELITYNKNSKKDSLNVLKYKLINNSNDIYYLNISTKNFKNISLSSKDETLFYKLNNIKDKKECKYGITIIDRTDSFINCENLINNYEKKYNYKEEKFKKNLFIYPKETIFFQTYIKIIDKNNLTDKIKVEPVLENNIEYEVVFFIPCDSIKFMKNIPWVLKENIKSKKAKIYHGNIFSENKLPLKIIE